MKSFLNRVFAPLLPGKAPCAKGGLARHVRRWTFDVGRSTFALLFLFFILPAHAYPPAPDHTFYGMVRDEEGNPMDLSGARIFIQSTNGVGANAPVIDSTEAGINYRLLVPMDSGRSLKISPLPHTRLQQNQDFQLKVLIGNTVYLPIEMVTPHTLGEPAASTRLDLTLGVDADRDGLPDAWEEALIALYGGSLEDIDPHDDTDGDGMTNLEEYLAGTYAFDPADGFRLTLTSVEGGVSTLEFLTISGRTYTVYASPDLQQWSPESFRIVTGGVPGVLQDSYRATDVRNLRIEVPPQAGTSKRFFKAVVQ